MTRILLAPMAALLFAACGGADTNQDASLATGARGAGDPQAGCAGGDDCPPTCDAMRCEPGTHCELVEVQCVRAPCHPQPQCLPDGDACAAVRCAGGTRCEVQPDGAAACVEDASACAAVLCMVGTVCRVGPDGAAGCVAPDGCRRTGCSGSVCADEDVVTTCEWRESYACYDAAACERQPDGRCGFTPTPALEACLAGHGATPAR
jgi:hypothetical protein